jgi:hypothetical protein
MRAVEKEEVVLREIFMQEAQKRAASVPLKSSKPRWAGTRT